MKALLFIFTLTASTLVCFSEQHLWTFKQGGKLTAELADFAGTNQIVVLTADGKRYTISVPLLIDEDQHYVEQIRDNQELSQLKSSGYIEFSSGALEHFSEKFSDQRGWMDADFHYLSTSSARHKDIEVGFVVEDKKGDTFYNCYVNKEILGPNWINDYSDRTPNPLAAQMLSFKTGDRLRLIGHAVVLLIGNESKAYFEVESVKLLKKTKSK